MLFPPCMVRAYSFLFNKKLPTLSTPLFIQSLLCYSPSLQFFFFHNVIVYYLFVWFIVFLWYSDTEKENFVYSAHLSSSITQKGGGIGIIGWMSEWYWKKESNYF